MAGNHVVESLGFDRIGGMPFRPFIVVLAGATEAHGVVPVSYTHLDVYKRQLQDAAQMQAMQTP